jgi:drug/metabolite transporter (DMT)-like permease
MNETEPSTNPEEQRHHHGGGTWIGVAFVLFGIIMILQTTGVARLENWWALFILIPAVGSFAAAVRSFRSSGGRFTKSAAGAIGGGLFMTAVALFFLFRVDWGQYWPVFIVLVGVSMLLGAFARRSQ